jgi:hypothetical protein
MSGTIKLHTMHVSYVLNKNYFLNKIIFSLFGYNQ